jgi:hypothetical protein
LRELLKTSNEAPKIPSTTADFSIISNNIVEKAPQKIIQNTQPEASSHPYSHKSYEYPASLYNKYNGVHPGYKKNYHEPPLLRVTPVEKTSSLNNS